MAIKETSVQKTIDPNGKLSFKFRFQITNNNNLVLDSETNKAIETSLMDFKVVKFGYRKKLSQRTDIELELNLTEARTENFVETLKIEFRPIRMMQVKAGLGRILEGGYEHINNDYSLNLISLYVAEHMPFTSGFGPVVEFHTKAFGDLTLQITKDVTNVSEDENTNGFPYFSNQQKQPAAIVQWLGKFGRIIPLLQLGTYDINHSSFGCFGASFQLANLKATFDHTIDNRNEKVVVVTEDLPIPLNHRYLNSSFKISYKLKDKITPFLRYNQFEVVQPTDTALNRSDRKGNSNLTTWDDNQVSWQVGVTADKWGKGFRPYLAAGQTSGTFLTPNGENETEEKTNTLYYVGVSGTY